MGFKFFMEYVGFYVFYNYCFVNFFFGFFYFNFCFICVFEYGFDFFFFEVGFVFVYIVMVFYFFLLVLGCVNVLLFVIFCDRSRFNIVFGEEMLIVLCNINRLMEMMW